LLHIVGCGVIRGKENYKENIREFCIFINNSAMLILSAMIFNGKTLILRNFMSVVIIHMLDIFSKKEAHITMIDF
jgi:hypothetical protein